MSERSIFLRALDITDAQQRNEYLEGACGGDSRRRAQIERLLRAHDEATDFLEDAPADVHATLGVGNDASTFQVGVNGAILDFLSPCADPQRLGTLGGYEVMEVLGQGGMGLVLRAFDVKLSRVVAIKVLAPELAANAMARNDFCGKRVPPPPSLIPTSSRSMRLMKRSGFPSS